MRNQPDVDKKGKANKPNGLWQTVTKTIIFTILIFGVLAVFLFVKGKFLDGGYSLDGWTILIAILPFVIYLVAAGKISEFRGGGFEFKFNEASASEVIYEAEELAYAQEEVAVKGSVGTLRSEILPRIAENPISTLVLKPMSGYYSPVALEEYLTELSRFDFFKYVLFLDEDGVFYGYVYARSLLPQLLDTDTRQEIVDLINSESFDDIQRIPGCRNHHIKSYMSNRETLRIMQNEGITDMAVVDQNMKFKGFTTRELITSRIVNNLMLRAK